jgi:ectoine hydroxylase-related dioxygenase (phytanoyl-CoA dioxygenase family)
MSDRMTQNVAPVSDGSAAAAALRHDGYCRVANVLDAALLGQVRGLSTAALGMSATPEHRAQWRAEGSLIPLSDHPAFSALIASSAIRGMFDALALEDCRYSSGYVISKPPGGPALFWHQDWWGWRHPISYTDRVAQIALFIYLTDTAPANGCLRVIPGSHRRRHRLHAVIDAHAEALARVDDPSNPAFAEDSDAVAVPVQAGDIVIADARLIHGAYPNGSGGERTCITLWFHPGYHDLPEALRARLRLVYRREGVDTDPGAAEGLRPDLWPEPHRSRIMPLLIDYAGCAEPEPWERSPVGLK